MKKSLVKIHTLLAASLLAGCFAYGADAPAPGAPPPGGAGPGGGAGRPGGGVRGGGAMALDEKQRELYRESMTKSSDDLRKLDEKLRAAQKELMQVVLAEKYDESAVRTKADAISKIQADMIVLRAKAFSSVSPTLKPEQREAMENSPMGSMMIMGGGMGGGMGRGFAPGGGGPGGPGGEGRPRRPGGGAGGAGGQGQ